MRSLKQSVVAFLRDEEGLTVVEYAIAGGLVGLAVIIGFTNLGTQRRAHHQRDRDRTSQARRKRRIRGEPRPRRCSSLCSSVVRHQPQ